MRLLSALIAQKKIVKKVHYRDAIHLAKIESNLVYTKYKYLQDFMLDESPEHSVMKAAQLGFTTGVIYRVLFVLLDGVRVLYLLPDSVATKEFSAGKLNPIIWNSRNLYGLCEVDNVRQKLIAGIPLYLRGANSRKQLKEVSVGLLVLDEFDEMKDEMMALAYERLSGHEKKQVIRLSTPGLPGKGIHAIYRTADQYNFVVPCFHCGKVQLLSLSNVNVEGGFFFCSKCKKPWTNSQRMKMNTRGKYRLEQKGNGRKCRYVNQLYSPTVSMKELCQKIIDAEGDEARTQELYNSVLAMPHESKGSRISRVNYDEAISSEVEFRGPVVIGIDVSQATPHYCVIARATEYGLVVLAVERARWDRIGKLADQYRAEMVVIDAQPERTKAKEVIEGLNCSGFRCLYPNQKDKIVLDNNRGIVSVHRTEIIDQVFSRFQKGTIRIKKGLAENESLYEHLHNTIRSYRQTRRGDWEAYYAESGPDHFMHALVYAEVATELVSGSSVGEKISGKFI